MTEVSNSKNLNKTVVGNIIEVFLVFLDISLIKYRETPKSAIAEIKEKYDKATMYKPKFSTPQTYGQKNRIKKRCNFCHSLSREQPNGVFEHHFIHRVSLSNHLNPVSKLTSNL